MQDLTSATVRSLSQVDFTSLGFPTSSPDPLDPYSLEGQGYIEFVTGRKAVSLPAKMDPLFTRACVMRVEQEILAGAQDVAETAADFDLIQSFGAGSYNETRRSGPVNSGLPDVNPWPSLNRLLWTLMETSEYPDDLVDEKRDYWLFTLKGIYGPAWQIVDVDWGRGLGLAASDPANFPFGAHNGLPWPNGPLGGA